MAIGRGRGPARMYPPDVEAKQAELAQELLNSGATWTEMMVRFYERGWHMSQTLLLRRIKEWGIAPEARHDRHEE